MMGEPPQPGKLFLAVAVPRRGWEGRITNTETRKKAEGRNLNQRLRQRESSMPDQSLFGFRASAFFRPSAFGD
jgi:hypothetical protein